MAKLILAYNGRLITADEFSIKKAQDVLKNEVIAIIGYGVQDRHRLLI